MSKVTMTGLMALTVGLAMVLIGAIFNSIDWTGGFDPTGDGNLNSVLMTVGYIVAGLSGIVLTALGVATAIKTNEK